MLLLKIIIKLIAASTKIIANYKLNISKSNLNLSQSSKMQKKIIHIVSLIRPGGGPFGYLYNLKKGIDEIRGDYNYDVCSMASSNSRENKFTTINLPNLILRNLKPLWHYLQLKGLLGISLEPLIARKDYIYISHVVTQAARLRFKYGTKIKIYLMPHAPVSYSEEVMSDLELKHGRSLLHPCYLKLLMRAEKMMFSKMDGIIVAAKQGLDGYFEGNGIKSVKIANIYEVGSGVPKFKEGFQKNDARQKLGLPQNKKVIGFFGRYNKDKGFDIYCEALSKFSEESNEEIIFISAGIGPIKPKKCQNYIDFGWRNDVELLISAADVVVIANRNTYFDLLPLEVMSLSRPVIVSNVGGNKKLISDNEFIEGFDLTVDSLVNKLKDFLKKSDNELIQLGIMAEESYRKKYDINKFLDNHQLLAQEILSKYQ